MLGILDHITTYSPGHQAYSRTKGYLVLIAEFNVCIPHFFQPIAYLFIVFGANWGGLLIESLSTRHVTAQRAREDGKSIIMPEVESVVHGHHIMDPCNPPTGVPAVRCLYV